MVLQVSLHHRRARVRDRGHVRADVDDHFPAHRRGRGGADPEEDHPRRRSVVGAPAGGPASPETHGLPNVPCATFSRACPPAGPPVSARLGVIPHHCYLGVAIDPIPVTFFDLRNNITNTAVADTTFTASVRADDCLDVARSHAIPNSMRSTRAFLVGPAACRSPRRRPPTATGASMRRPYIATAAAAGRCEA